MVIISILACCLSNNCSPPRFKLGQHLFASKYQLVPALDRTGAVASASFKSYLTKTLKKKNLTPLCSTVMGGGNHPHPTSPPAPHHKVHSTIFNLRTCPENFSCFQRKPNDHRSSNFLPPTNDRADTVLTLKTGSDSRSQSQMELWSQEEKIVCFFITDN